MKNDFKKIYRAKHPTNRKKRVVADGQASYWHLLRNQLLVCGILLMGVLTMERLPSNEGFEHIRRTVMGEMAFSRYNYWYEHFMVNLFPFSYIAPGVLPEPTMAVLGEGEGEGVRASTQNLAATLIRDIAYGVELYYADGIVVNTRQEENVLSPVAGIVVERGTDATREIGDYIVIQLQDDSLLTVGFLQNIRVAYLDHVLVGTPLGSGTIMEDIGEDSYFYLSVQSSSGQQQDTLTFLNGLVNHEQAD
ncbi:MAG: hypothetical protein FWF59_13045 [Turicibacter sp.]|nr:hypothetical protein [Turicibacter sp.]